MISNFFVLPDRIELKAKKGETLLSALRRNKMEIDHSCDGMGSCGTCRVIVRDWGPGNTPAKIGEVELEMIESRGFKDEERLSCQIEPQNGMIIEIPSSI